MRHLLLGLCLLLTSFSALAQEKIDFKVLSYSEFFQMIEDEPSDEFSLKNARILIDIDSDSAHVYTGFRSSNRSYERTEYLVINKKLILENVFFNDRPDKRIMNDQGLSIFGAFHHIQFTEQVSIKNSVLTFDHCQFEEPLFISYNKSFENIQFQLDKRTFFYGSELHESQIQGGFYFFVREIDNLEETIGIQFGISNNVFNSNGRIISNLGNLWIENNQFLPKSEFEFNFEGGGTLDFKNNSFNNTKAEIKIGTQGAIRRLNLSENTFTTPVKLSIEEISSSSTIGWSQFKEGFIDASSLFDYSYNKLEDVNLAELRDTLKSDGIMETYLQSARFQDKVAYKNEIKLLGKLNGLYKEQHDIEYSNLSYIAIKDLETARHKYLYKTEPSFDTFFKWRINQFLKAFSAYGTRPEKAITMSVYVIIIFAFIYLFFPNYWDSHGKDRILHRYKFFFNYLNKDAGMHDVYLDGKQDELAHYEGFKNFFIENGKTVPKFFLATALPLYRWSTASTRSSSWFLQKIDIFKGKWADLPAPQRAAKTVLLSLAFAIALAYDIFIKMLNALMLSINTFTTLGFGEIPIKGLPRYLAIIQGFIGWFMLTIFSVSLISQLLN